MNTPDQIISINPG